MPVIGALERASGSFLGRERELDELAELIAGDRLVTLTGAPGIGKSRLALELAGRVGGGYPGGTPLVELAAIGRPADLPGAVAAVLSVVEVTGQPLTDTLVARLSRRRMLLVLDNCEHLVDASAELVAVLLAGCSELRVLATSRESLGLAGERVWPVAPLAVPDPEQEASPEALANFPAVALFVARAQAIQPGFSLNAFVAPSVAEICRRLDGIPLAIELAAARAESLTPEEIADRLADRFALLNKRAQSGLAHHQTLEGALDWSHELLPEPERALLRRLSVFAGDFGLGAAEMVCAGEQLEAEEVSALLAQLTQKSLVVAGAGGYRLLETIRVYAAERLEDAGEAAALRASHARFYLALAEQAEPELTGRHQEEWFERLEAERANLRSAIEWSLSHGQEEWALRLVGALVLFWRIRCRFSDGREWLEVAVSSGGREAPVLRAKALWGAGFMAMMAGDYAEAMPLLEECLRLHEELGDVKGCARALLILGNCRQCVGDDSALELLQKSATLAREADDRWCLAHALAVAGYEQGNRYELAASRRLLEECLAVARETEDKQSLRMGLTGLGWICISQGDHRAAGPALEEAVAVTSALREDHGRASALQYLGWLAVRKGEYARARDALEETLALFRETNPANSIGPLALLAQVAHIEGDRSSARRLYEEALTLAPAGKSLLVFTGMAALAVDEGDTGAARRLLEEALALARTGANRSSEAGVLDGLGRLARDAGETQRATAFCREALELRRRHGDARGMVASVESFAALAVKAGRYERAAQLLAAAEAAREAHLYARVPAETTTYESSLALVREELSSEAFRAACREGKALSVEDAAARVANGDRGGTRPRDGWHSLTEREQEVAGLVAEGMSNSLIAERLFISLETVKTHLSKVFAKLGVARRAQLAEEVRRQRRP